MIQIPVLNVDGQQVDTLQLDELVLGGEVRPALLKQAYVRLHANRRQGTAATKGRDQIEGSTRKLYKQKHTGNARRGPLRTNIMKGGGPGHRKVPHSWRLDMPVKMRRLANRNAVLAKAVDGEIKLIDTLQFEKPSTKQFAKLLSSLKIDRSCLFALADTRTSPARSAANLDNISITRVDRLNAFDLLNHRYLLVERDAFAGWVKQVTEQVKDVKGAAHEQGVEPGVAPGVEV
ncbi:MAG: 50S ribosomal protein L4 [Phycisphaeraceae bacterium]